MGGRRVTRVIGVIPSFSIHEFDRVKLFFFFFREHGNASL